MRNIRSEHTANLAMAQATVNGKDVHIGKHFNKHVPKRMRDKQRETTFLSLFKIGAIK